MTDHYRGESDCRYCYNKKKIPLTIREICPPSPQSLVEAIYLQNIDAVTETLSRQPELANSRVSLICCNYKRQKQCQCDPWELPAPTPKTVEPLLLFAATIHHYKSEEKYTYHVPEKSVPIVRVIVEYGGRIFSDAPCGFVVSASNIACSDYGTNVQDCPEILQLCMQSGEPLTQEIETLDGAQTRPAGSWRGTLRSAAIRDADNSMRLLLDAMQAQGCNLQIFMGHMYAAARHGSKNVIDEFLSRGGAAFIDMCNPNEPTLLSVAARCRKLEPKYRFDSAAIANKEAICCSLIDAGANTQDAWLLPSLCQWAGPTVLGRLLTQDSQTKLSEYLLSELWDECAENKIGFVESPSLLHIASVYFNTAGVETLIALKFPNEIDVNGRTPLHWLSLEDMGHYLAASPDLTTEAQKETEAEAAAFEHQAVRLARLLVEGAHIEIDQQDEYGRTALYYACLLKRAELIKALLQLGAKTSIAESKICHTPLHAFGTYRKMWELRVQARLPYPAEMLSYPAHMISTLGECTMNGINARDNDGKTALAVACSEYSSEEVRVLLAIGADPNISDNRSWSPLHHAMRRPKHLRMGEFDDVEVGTNTTWHVACARMEDMRLNLLAAGADENARNETGETAADVADREAKAYARDMDHVGEKLEDMCRHGTETERNRRGWRRLIQEEVRRSNCPNLDDSATLHMMVAVGLERRGFGLGRGVGAVPAPPAHLDATHRSAIAAVLARYWKHPRATGTNF